MKFFHKPTKPPQEKSLMEIKHDAEHNVPKLLWEELRWPGQHRGKCGGDNNLT